MFTVYIASKAPLMVRQDHDDDDDDNDDLSDGDCGREGEGKVAMMTMIGEW